MVQFWYRNYWKGAPQVNNTPSPQNRKKPLDGEAITAIFLLSLTLFLVLTVSILTFRACDASGQSGTTPPYTPPAQTTPPPTNGSDTPLFSGGVAMPYPTEDESTQEAPSTIDAYYAILIDAASGRILAQKNAELAFSPASMTKVMTLIVACENLTQEDLMRQLPLSHDIVEYVTTGNYYGMDISLPQESGGMTCIGDTYTIKDLLYGIGVSSAADCTYMIAKEIAGSEPAFVNLMNAKAKELGLVDTEFDNIVGFDSATNVTSARDMAIIMTYAMQSDLICDILKPRTSSYTITAHWEKDGVPATYKVSLKPSYASRIDKYPSFSLSGVTLEACKTGYTNESFIVASAISKATGARYILVLGDRSNGTQENISTKFKKTMIDMETMFNTFVP